MTFIEFFAKKKIDLVQLEKEEQDLFLEFKNHFEQMGEKSFDHTKKYWFNKLRLKYPLKADEKPLEDLPKQPLKATEAVPTLEATSEITTKPLGFKPRFAKKP